MKSALELWPAAKPLMLPYEGGASQIHIFDLPHQLLQQALDTFSEHVHEPKISTLNGYTFEDSIGFSDENRSKLAIQDTPHHVIAGQWRGKFDMSLWLIMDKQSNKFDAELVFWADQLFPQPKDEGACIDVFSSLILFVEGLRSINPEGECALTMSEVADPRDERDEWHTLFW